MAFFEFTLECRVHALSRNPTLDFGLLLVNNVQSNTQSQILGSDKELRLPVNHIILKGTINSVLLGTEWYSVTT